MPLCLCPEGFGGSPFLDCFPLNSTERTLEPVTDIDDIDTEPSINADELVTESDFQIDTGNDIATEMGHRGTTEFYWMANITETISESSGDYTTTDQFFTISTERSGWSVEIATDMWDTTTENNDVDDDSNIMVITESDRSTEIDETTTEILTESSVSSTEMNDYSTTTDEYSSARPEINFQIFTFPVYIPKITTELPKPITDSYKSTTNNVLKIAPKTTTQMKPEEELTTDGGFTQENSSENSQDFTTIEFIEQTTTDSINAQSDATTIGDGTTTDTVPTTDDDRIEETTLKIGNNSSTEIYVNIEMSAVAA